MRFAVTFASRLLVVVALVALTVPVLEISGTTTGPYVSALTDLAASGALAAPSTCNRKQCVVQGNRGLCKPLDGFNCFKQAGSCRTSFC